METKSNRLGKLSVEDFHGRPNTVKRVAVHFARFGPYHLARIDAAARALADTDWEVAGLETSGSDATYAWKEERGSTGWERRTVFPGEVLERIPAARMRAGIEAALNDLQPAAVAIAGWGSADARACLEWCGRSGAKAIVMSETREVDGQRVWWKEWGKTRVVRRFDGALVGGKSHRDYLAKLGMSAERVRFGYDVVDNAYFATEAAKEKSRDLGMEVETRKYFLASSRFVERKNLDQLVEAYARLIHQPSVLSHRPLVWDLCLLGNGELKGSLIAHAGKLGLRVEECAPWELKTEHRKLEVPGTSPVVFFPGFRQIDELPRFYAHAGCFVHPALEEPWGLVINEAMACGLPVLAGNNVGAAEELVENRVNGWKFHATQTDEMVACMERVASLSEEERRALGRESARILEERCPTEAFGKGLMDILTMQATARCF